MGKCKSCGKDTFQGEEYCMMCKPSKKTGTRDENIRTEGARNMTRQELRDLIFPTFFKDEKKSVEREDIYLDAARKAAALFYNSRPKMSRTQLRSFLRYLRGLEIPLRFPTRPRFETIVPQLNELYAFTVYQANREKPSYPVIFKEFFESYLPLIKSDEREFNFFVKYVSSIIAYSTEIEREEKRTKK